MFDIGFWELALIGVVALLVVGPDRLPALARTVGLWVGRIRRYVSTVRDDIEREIRADELKQMLNKPNDLNPLQDVIEETTSTISDARKEFADVEKKAEDLTSGETPAPLGVSDTTRSEADETGADAVTPPAATTTAAEAVSARSEPPAQTPSETPDEAVENPQNDEQRAR